MATTTAMGSYGFKVSPRVLAPLGLEQLSDPALAVLELVKNSWDADATRVQINVDQKGRRPSITVKDNGTGMSQGQFRDRWLVIGTSHKRGQKANRRPLIGEKGLGRLATYALGTTLTLKSAGAKTSGFQATINWDEFFQSPSVEEYKVKVRPTAAARGTIVTISGLRYPWTDRHTDFVSTYAQFLTAVPGEKFRVSMEVDGINIALSDPLEAISSLAEAELEMGIEPDGTPVITNCMVEGADYSWVHFRSFKPQGKDPRLAGSTLSIKFYRRDKIARKLTDVLTARDVNELLEKYQGIRIYRNGINVPPYGLAGNDWAALEKQRTSTGGPTMVPGNSQLIGELHVPSASHLTITAGRSGFANQDAVSELAAYVKWAVKELGTARRAHALGIEEGAVPVRVDTESKRDATSPEKAVRRTLTEISRSDAVLEDPELKAKLVEAREQIDRVFDKNEMTLRLYAQLASTGIAATSFAHELRTDFDVVSSAIKEIVRQKQPPDDQLKGLLVGSWGRIKNFVALFRLLPVKVRRNVTELDQRKLRRSVDGVFKLVPSDYITASSVVGNIKVRLVPAELDSILLNLVSNAVKAIAESPRAKSGQIRVDLHAKGEDLYIDVSDNGSGLAPGLQTVMFEPLEGKFAEGTGMGLAIVRYIAERYKGSVTICPVTKSAMKTQIRVTLKRVLR